MVLILITVGFKLMRIHNTDQIYFLFQAEIKTQMILLKLETKISVLFKILLKLKFDIIQCKIKHALICSIVVFLGGCMKGVFSINLNKIMSFCYF